MAAIPRSSLRGFLVHAKGALRTAIEKSQRITFVIGNESADLDSLTCSMLYAYLRSMAPPRNAFTPLYIPVANIPGSEVHIRPEFLALLPHANLESQHLITLDDLPNMSIIESRLRPENTKWILVDHNALQGQLGKIYSSRVGGVIDHHEDEGKVPAETEDEPRTIEKSGSCSSLVTEHFKEAWDSLAASAVSSGAAHAQGDSLTEDGAVINLWDAQVAQLGLASILVDTSNLQSKDKTTEHDIKAVEYLESKVMGCPQVATEYSRNDFFNEIDSARKDICALKLQDILRKDYKQWDEQSLRLGVSSAVKSLSFLIEKAGEEQCTQNDEDPFFQALQQFAEARELDLYAVMTTSTSSGGQFQRELLLWARNQQARSAGKAFASTAKDELGLEDWHGSDGKSHEKDGDSEWRKIWWQRKVEHSRKRVAPLLRESMAKK